MKHIERPQHSLRRLSSREQETSIRDLTAQFADALQNHVEVNSAHQFARYSQLVDSDPWFCFAKTFVLIQSDSLLNGANDDLINRLCNHVQGPVGLQFAIFKTLPRRLVADKITPIAGLLVARLNGLEPYERLSEILDRKDRKARGVYFTPRPLAASIVQKVDEQLKTKFKLSEGLVSRETRKTVLGIDDDRSFVHVIDPAMGSGVFLSACVDAIQKNSISDEQLAEFLNRLFGIDICPVAVAIAHLNVLRSLPTSLLERFNPTLNLFCLDTLELPGHAENENVTDESASKIVETPFSVCMGNPPFGTLNVSAHPSMKRLMRGESLLEGGDKSYFTTSAGKISEKKTWLYDSYVQFFRFAQWQIEKSGAGLVTFISNGNYLDNISFSGMRYQLLSCFSEIDVWNTSDLVRDPQSSTFAIATPVVVAQLTKEMEKTANSLATITRHNKTFLPHADRFEFSSLKLRTRFKEGILLTDLMPLHSSAIVTARDWLTVGFSNSELNQRIRNFADLTIPESEFREIASTRTRSTRYAAGDSRGWNLTDAREKMSLASDWQKTIVPCWYRAMDRRDIALHPLLVDWPRSKVTRLLTSGGNMALVARRQMVEGRRANFFWIVDAPAVDGIIRSDNRGSESVFPLFHVPNSIGDGDWNVSNFDTTLPGIQDWMDCGTPADLLAMIYAQMWSTRYQANFNNDLLRSYPRLFIERSAMDAEKLVKLGRQLIAAHLLECSLENELELPKESIFVSALPVWKSGEIRIGNEVFLTEISQQVWRFSVGAHQIAKKWLKDRRGRTLFCDNILEYISILKCIEKSIHIVEQIDQVIENSSGRLRDWLCH